MLSTHELESLRRSAAMAPLTTGQLHELIEMCSELTRERTAIRALLAELPDSFSEVRRALNDLQRIVGTDCVRPRIPIP